MADYINKNILSQAYIHVEPSTVSTPEELEKFKNHIRDFARSRSDFFLYPDLAIEIDFEEGSLKARVTVLGTILLVMQGIANYSSFRESVFLIYSDSKRLAEYIVSESQFLAGSKHEDVIRLEARTGVIGSLHKITLQLEQIKRGAQGGMLAKDIPEKIDDAIKNIDELMSNLQDRDDFAFIQMGLTSIALDIPEEPKPPKDKFNDQIAINNFRLRRKKLIEFITSKT